MNKNIEKLFNSFAIALNVDPKTVTYELTYQGIVEWDSITHMVLISQLEEDFNVSIDTEDVIDMSSIEKAIEILQKYNIQF
jgi:acyl carrier protein